MAGAMIGREVIALQRVKGMIARDGVVMVGEVMGRRDRGWELLGWAAVYVGLAICGWGAIVR